LDDMVKKEDGNKVFQDFKKQSMMTTDGYNSDPAKSNWSSNIKYSCHSTNKETADLPVRLCRLLMLTAFKLKIFGDDAYGKVSTQCKVGANKANNLLERNRVFFPAGSTRARLPLRLRPLNEETIKAAIVELLRCTSNTNLQRYYIGDGEGKMAVAGFCLPCSFN
jgi:hypothetical protein